MEGIFKQKLLNLRHPPKPSTFSEALLGDTSWLQKASQEKPQKLPPKEAFSEKIQVIESLERFAQEKVSEQESPVIKFPGAEIVVKSEPEWKVGSFDSLSNLRKNLKLDHEFLNVVLSGKEAGKVKVVFVTEKFRNWTEVSPELKSGFINELIVGFPLKTAELFERMISAMKLDASEVIVYPVEGQSEDFDQDIMSLAGFFRPEIIITLGAKATTKILKSNDRLSLIHGQFFSRKINDQGFQVVPLFHPSIIETNQNMKKTAWADMQKIMKHLKKLP